MLARLIKCKHHPLLGECLLSRLPVDPRSPASGDSSVACDMMERHLCIKMRSSGLKRSFRSNVVPSPSAHHVSLSTVTVARYAGTLSFFNFINDTPSVIFDGRDPLHSITTNKRRVEQRP